MMPPLPPRDIDSLLGSWPGALACPAWRLRGESPSPGLFDEIRSGADHAVVVRDGGEEAVGLLEVREVEPATRSAHLGFLLPPAAGTTAMVDEFVATMLVQLGLVRIDVLVDEDMLDVLADTSLPLDRTGLLRDHTFVGPGRYVDRHVFEFTGEAGPS